MAAKATVEYLLVAGVVVGSRFTFANGAVREVLSATLPDAVRAHAEANGVRESLRDTYAGAESADEALAAFDKRLETMKGGEYAARGGARLDWVGDIMLAAQRLDPKATEATMAKRREALASMDPATLKAWLNDKARRPLARMVDVVRKERAAERAKAAIGDGGLDW
jgi:hypothetical protein